MHTCTHIPTHITHTCAHTDARTLHTCHLYFIIAIVLEDSPSLAALLAAARCLCLPLRLPGSHLRGSPQLCQCPQPGGCSILRCRSLTTPVGHQEHAAHGVGVQRDCFLVILVGEVPQYPFNSPCATAVMHKARRVHA